MLAKLLENELAHLVAGDAAVAQGAGGLAGLTQVNHHLLLVEIRVRLHLQAAIHFELVAHAYFQRMASSEAVDIAGHERRGHTLPRDHLHAYPHLRPAARGAHERQLRRA
ncbi:hypothetical protein D3C79_973220 [compost metagenome]